MNVTLAQFLNPVSTSGSADSAWDYSQVFVDYLSFRGDAPDSWPEVHSGYSEYSGQGWPDPLWIACAYGTGYQVRCVNGIAEFRGNPSRVERADNVFGYRFDDAVVRCRDLMSRHGLSGEWRKAKLTRIDLTMNVETGSPESLKEFMQQNRIIDLPRKHKGTTSYGAVFWDNTQSRLTIYDKARELFDAKRLDVDGVAWLRADKRVQDERDAIAEYCHANGVARIELKLKRDFLRSRNLRDPRSVSQEVLQTVFAKEVDPLKKVLLENGADLSDAEFGVLCKWIQGAFDKSALAKNTFYKYRRNIREATGYDIAAEGPISMYRGKKRVVSRTCYPPEFYLVPRVEDLA